MAALDIAISALKSRTVRNAIGSSGIRKIAKPAIDQLGEPDENGLQKIIGKIWDAAKSVVGWITGKIKSLFNFDASKAFGQFVNAFQFIWNFNFQATDKDLEENIKQNFIAIAGQVGGLVGSSVGYLVGGGGLGGLLFVFNQAAGAKALAAVGDEAKDELLGQFSALISATAQNLIQAGLTSAFINVRKWIKGSYAQNNPILNTVFRGMFGDKADETINNWGKEGNEPWSFATALETAIESIDNEYLRTFVENAVENFAESFVEAGFVVASSWDAKRAEQKAIATQVLGVDRTVQIIPDRQADDQAIILSGKENTIRPMITQTMANYQILGNRDIGAIYGLPMAEAARKMPSNLSLTIVYSSHPPGRVIPAGTPKKRHEVHLYSVNKAALDWEKVKLAVGKNGHTFGRWSTITTLSTRDKFVVYTDDPVEGQNLADSLMALVKSDMVGQTQNEELKKGQRVPGKPLYKEPVKVYPLYMTVMNSQKVLSDAKAKGSLNGSYLSSTQKIEIWMTDKPSYFDDLINELFKMPGADDDT